ncbi:hypothetical protein [Kribbella sp. NPDC051770]|uniref:hypothetical protein n=1 Tax=Kribbella sp. NPDC051770 TaxID=3155413 RepID=UPI003434AC01
MEQIEGPNGEQAAQALLDLTHHVEDRDWLQGYLLKLTSTAGDPNLRALATTCLGHVARLDGAVRPNVVERLVRLLDDPALGGIAEDALDDIRAFTDFRTDKSLMNHRAAAGIRPWTPTEWKQLTADLWTAYGDLQHPRRRFPITAVHNGPPQQLLTDLERLAAIQDDTDINCEVCFRLHLELEPALIIQLSMVGQYAVLTRSPNRVLTTEQDCHSTDELTTYRAITSAGYRLLSTAHLETTVDLALPDHDEVTVHQALFEQEE